MESAKKYTHTHAHISRNIKSQLSFAGLHAGFQLPRTEIRAKVEGLGCASLYFAIGISKKLVFLTEMNRFQLRRPFKSFKSIIYQAENGSTPN